MSETARSAAAGASGAEKKSEWSRLMGVFFSPVTTFQDIARKPTWAVPLVILVLFALVSNALVLPHMDWEEQVAKQMEKAKERGVKVDESKIETQVQIVKRIGTVSVYAGSIIGPPVVSLLIALIYFGVIRIFGGAITYLASFAVVCFGNLPSALKLLFVGLAALNRESISQMEVQAMVPSNVGFFLSKEQVGAALYAASQYIDLFAFWGLALTVVGLSCASNWSRGKCAAVVIGLYAVAVVIFTALATLATSMGG